jgi:multiple sugar transport system substrate-binding protein
MNRFYRRLMLVTLALMLVVTGVTVSAQDSTIDVGVPLDSSVSGDVEFWHFWGSPIRRNAIRRVVALCQQALPNVTITEVFKPFGEIWTANIAAVAAGSGMPDVIVSDRLQLGREASDGIYQSLQPWIERDGVDSARFYPFTWEQTVYEGESYGIPFETDVRVLFYNKTLFEQAGLDPNDPPETWEELVEYDEALRQIDENGEIQRIGFYPLEGPSQDIWALANSHDWVLDDGSVVVNSPEVVETYEWIKSFVDAYGGYDNIQEFRGTFGPAPNDGFMSGRVAMRADIAGYASGLNFYRPRITLAEGENPVEFQWGVAPLPHAEDSEATSWSGGFTMSIPTGSDNPEAAWEVLKCLTSPAGQASWARDTYAIPSDIQAANDPILLADPNWQFFMQAMDNSQSSTLVTGYPNYMEQLNQRNEAIYRGDVEIQQALDEAQAAIDETIATNSP